MHNPLSRICTPYTWQNLFQVDSVTDRVIPLLVLQEKGIFKVLISQILVRKTFNFCFYFNSDFNSIFTNFGIKSTEPRVNATDSQMGNK